MIADDIDVQLKWYYDIWGHVSEAGIKGNDK